MKMSLDDMAKATHFAKSTLGNVETGRRRATPEIIEAYERGIQEAAGEVFKRDITHPGLAAVLKVARCKNVCLLWLVSFRRSAG
ncbi:helix-turn-helix domain-containing protein [Saccharopolyspora hattusasensis]|uniref:helix-turn-helix domain-containing protein n=1 Tax=Saccharopolyspora hattusasensis TaxID=1128679 RepID=UPI003D955A19